MASPERAAGLYLPYFAIASVTICRNFEVQLPAAVIAAVMGAVPMLAQGFNVLALGGSLFW